MTFAVTGIPSTFQAPLIALELLLGQGPSTAGAGARTTIYTAPQLSTGLGTVNTVYEIGDEKRAIDLFGAGSPLHRLLRAHLKANSQNRVYAMPYAASSGGVPVAADGTFTITGTPARSGVQKIGLCEEDIDVGFTTSDTATTIGDSLAAKINALTHLPVTAANVAGVVTVTAKIDGASQNAIYRMRAVDDPGSSVTVATSGATVGTGTGTAGVDGTTTENANLTTALAAQEASLYYYKGFSVHAAADLATIKTHIAANAEPKAGLRSVAAVGAVGALSATQTIATGVNHERVSVVWQLNSDHDPATLAANYLAVRQKREETDWSFNFDDYAEADWLIKRAYADSDWPDLDDVDDAVTDGIIPIKSKQTGSLIGMSVNTRSKDSAGTLDDFRATETHRVSVLDGIAANFEAQHRLTFKGFKISEHPVDSSGTPDPNAVLPPKVTTPYLYRGWVMQRLRNEITNGQLQESEWADSLQVRIDPANKSRFQVRASGRVIDQLHQTTYRISESTPN